MKGAPLTSRACVLGADLKRGLGRRVGPRAMRESANKGMEKPEIAYTVPKVAKKMVKKKWSRGSSTGKHQP